MTLLFHASHTCHKCSRSSNGSALSSHANQADAASPNNATANNGNGQGAAGKGQSNGNSNNNGHGKSNDDASSRLPLWLRCEMLRQIGRVYFRHGLDPFTSQSVKRLQNVRNAAGLCELHKAFQLLHNSQ